MNTTSYPTPMRRGLLTWYCYLLVGFFTYLLNIQGNILPFLQSELKLSYRDASLHFSAIALGMIVVGLFGDGITGRLGRRNALWLASASVMAGAVLQCLAPNAATSIASCFLIGCPGSLIPAIAFGLIGDIQKEHSDVAFGEASAITYVFGILGPLAISLSLMLGAGWRNALLLGAALGVIIVFSFRRVVIADVAQGPEGRHGRLPPAYWAFWCLLASVVALEFSVLFWAPAYLERVAGLSTATAAASAAAFSVAMIVGRAAGSFLVRRISAPKLLVAALLVSAGGFLVYWGVAQSTAAVAGLFMLGLGIAPLYPLTVGLAIAAAGPQTASASARFMLAVGISILSMPALLGALADAFGLHAAHLVLPGLVLAGLAFLGIGLAVRKREPALG
ncbi:MAG: MFS transporter [Alphaproteobacteria bacterium]|nr:MFS transporter [Alphaproteobacteria bacterium]